MKPLKSLKPLKPSNKPQKPPLKPLRAVRNVASITGRRLDTAYDNYLINYLDNSLVVQSTDLQEMCHVHQMALRCTDIPFIGRKMSKLYCNQLFITMSDVLQDVEKIRGAFENLVDFTGEETLMEIQSALSKKYDELPVHGVTVDEPMFVGNEVESLAQKLKAGLRTDDDENTVMGFCIKFVETMKQLREKQGETKRINDELKEECVALLEECSLSICEDAQKYHQRELEKGTNLQDSTEIDDVFKKDIEHRDWMLDLYGNGAERNYGNRDLSFLSDIRGKY